MKIAIVTHNIIRGDGQGRINLELAKYLIREGHQCTLVSETLDTDLLGGKTNWIEIKPWFKRPALFNCPDFVRLADRFIDSTRKDYDAIVANGHTMVTPHHVNLCQFVHGAWIHSPVHVSKLARGPKSWYQWAYTRYNAHTEKIAYNRTRIVVPPSQKIREELLSIGVPDSKIRVIYNGVELQEFHPGKESREELGLPPRGLLALFVGDIRTTRKNLDTTLRALVKVPNLHLAVAGSLPGSPFPAMAESLGIKDRVTFLGFRRDIGRLMRAVDLFIFPSRYEAGTLVLLEALASGLPVVTARTAGGCEVMGDGAGRILEDPNDVDALAAAIAEMTESESRRRDAAVAARQVAEKYSWTSMAENYYRVIEESCRS